MVSLQKAGQAQQRRPVVRAVLLHPVLAEKPDILAALEGQHLLQTLQVAAADLLLPLQQTGLLADLRQRAVVVVALAVAVLLAQVAQQQLLRVARAALDLAEAQQRAERRKQMAELAHLAAAVVAPVSALLSAAQAALALIMKT